MRELERTLTSDSMPKRTLVTYGTDGFRDFVTLPDGQSLNLGSVSVLNLVVALARTGSEAKRSLDAFLANGEATLAVNLEQLFGLLEPKKARWARIENALISDRSKSHMNLDILSLVSTRLASVEAHLQGLGSGGYQVSEVLPLVQESVGEILSAVTPPSDTKVAAVDKDMLRELEVYLDNEGSLQAQRKTILKGILSGNQDAKSVQGAWAKWVDAGAKSFAREFETDAKDFTDELRTMLASKLAAQTIKAIQDGEYDHLKSATTQQEDVSDESTKEASEEAALVNEGIAHAVMAKVERALQACSTSNHKNASSGKMDLHRISSELSEVLQNAELSSPQVRASLLSLTKKADHVLSFFSR